MLLPIASSLQRAAAPDTSRHNIAVTLAEFSSRCRDILSFSLFFAARRHQRDAREFLLPPPPMLPLRFRCCVPMPSERCVHVPPPRATRLCCRYAADAAFITYHYLFRHIISRQFAA